MSNNDSTAIVEQATCLGCGCLCDDIRVTVEDGRVVEAARACSIGRPWFESPRPGLGHPAASIDGRPSGLQEALDRAAEILGEARAPLVWGLSRTTVEAVRAALAIADRIGSVVDLAGSSEGGAGLAAFQRVGLVSSSLGEVKDRADLVVFWGVDPQVTHPRHQERYSVDPIGRFVPQGRSGRFVVVVDVEPSESSRSADLFVPIVGDRQGEAVDVLRALVREIAIDPSRAGRSSGVPFDQLQALADRLKACRYGALFHRPWKHRLAAESLARLVAELNEGRRFVALGLGRSGDDSGASSVLAWQAGAPSSVDFGMGHPRHLPGEATLGARLRQGEVDAALMVADDPADWLDAEALAKLAAVASIRIAPGATRPELPSSVAFDVARHGLESSGTVERVDGVMLPLRPSIASGLPTDLAILEALRERLGQVGPRVVTGR